MTDTKDIPETDMSDLSVATAQMSKKLQSAKDALGSVIFGQDAVLDLALITVLSGGHGLLVGLPGLAKTRLVETMGTVLGLHAQRVQFTPDLMPSDILGSEILEEDDSGKRTFRFIEGPAFSQLLMADEINRASPRTQSALLQAMQEHQVTVAGHHYDLPAPFHVLATQNPIEHEGTYPLPEAQLDRFLVQIDITYPDRASERRMMIETTGSDDTAVTEVLSTRDLLDAQSLVRRLPVGDSVVDAILDLVNWARPGSENDLVGESLEWGPGPRASQALMLTVRARALLQGRLAPSIDDVIAMAGPVLKHRMALTFSARADGQTIDALIETLTERLA
ncbi:AAA family ATPase [Coralliovum pocilloporae]|uniref:AAA family ATPase n=1 Tax=Coralliovum pocilloporae TaxID=3066369 RepID=UPI003D9C2E41